MLVVVHRRRGRLTVLYVRAPGVRVEAIGNGWAAFSVLSGDTLLLNDEAAAILEILAQGPADSERVCAELALHSGINVSEIVARVGDSWTRLTQAGLVLALPGNDPRP